MRTLLTIALLALLLPCTAKAQTPQSSREEQDIMEATFRYIFTHNASGQKTNATVYFLSINAKDPDDDFMKRFSGNTQPVKKASRAGHNSGTVVMDPETGNTGLIFEIHKVTVIDGTHARVDGGYYEAGDSSSGNLYDLEKKDGNWIVVKDVMEWIS